MAILVRSSWSNRLAQVIVTVAGHECTIFYIVSITRNTLAISSQCIIVLYIIAPETAIALNWLPFNHVCAYMAISTSLQATISIIFITNVHNISKRFLRFLIFIIYMHSYVATL